MSQLKQKIWQALQQQATIPKQGKPNKTKSYQICAVNIHLDYTSQHISPNILQLLFELADACFLKEKIQALMRGDNVNVSENKPALHTALRAPDHSVIYVNQSNVMPDIIKTRRSIHDISEQIRSNQWLGFSGKPITDIVNIGIGGSHFGAQFCISSFSDLTLSTLRYHFISDLDPTEFQQIIATLQPETTLFIIASKSFTTPETMHNAQKAKQWIGLKPHAERHFIAITANQRHAENLGFKTILPIWDWVGGRYSLCSAINLITAIAIGYEAFSQMLAGAHSMDTHFLETDFSANLPVLLALLGIWNNNFLGAHNLLMLVYAQQLKYLVPYIQQLDMESNGKSIDNQNNRISHATGPIIWGGLGNHAQHSYYQLLCQGTHRITADFITLNTFKNEPINHLCKSKINTLSNGINYTDNLSATIQGQLPLNHICLQDNTPYTIGSLIALYEHKIYAQSVIWNINPFNQPGVESAKKNMSLHV